MALSTSVSLSTQSPLSYNDWLRYQTSLNPESDSSAYMSYVQGWYGNQTSATPQSSTIKQEFIKLAKDLSYLFNIQEQANPFLANINYENDEDLIYAIPFFAQKLKQIAIVLQNKRESVKRAKLKYNLVGSDYGLEKLLYDYVLKSFTNTENSITQVPASPLINYFPSLSSVKDDFFIEIEELHDTTTYFDSDPSVPLERYLDITQLMDTVPLSGIDNQTINYILSTRFLNRVAETPLSNIFKSFLLEVPSLSTASLSADAYNLVYNEIYNSQKSLGENVYALTAVTVKQLNLPNAIMNLGITQGNNWFYFPSGNKIITEGIYNNTFEPITLNDSNLLSSGATGGTSYKNSDLIFTDKNGVVEGAWLQGAYKTYVDETMKVTLNGSSTRDFIFPFAGISLAQKGLNFENYSVDDTNNILLEKLNPNLYQQVLSSYYTSTIANSSCNPIYLNQTQLINSGSHPSYYSTNADNVIKRVNISPYAPSYTEYTTTPIEQAYLYKFDRTDLPIRVGTNQIHWPILTYNSTIDIPVTIKNDYCLPINLADINSLYTMTGSIAGLNFGSSDVIYKLNAKNSSPIEAAWLGSSSVSSLDTQHGAIQIYNTSAINCSQPINGAVQAGLSFVAQGLQLVSFVWNDVDTYADNVFKYVDHLPSCPYGKTMPHDLYVDQDYQNSNPINSLSYWTQCDCHSVNYSPIGNTGNTVLDYNGMADYLFADPQGLGVNFALNSWHDTRGLDPNNSPQFSFYQLTSGAPMTDKNVGFGKGSWKTGNGQPFVLKTGKRYSYYRSSLRTDSTAVNASPYFVSNYQYKDIRGLYTSESTYDLVILIDLSNSENNNLDNIKKTVTNIVDKILNNSNNNVQISIVTFGTNQSVLTYLTNDFASIELLLAQIQTLPKNEYLTDIGSALFVAQNILTVSQYQGGSNFTLSLHDLCSRLNFAIQEKTIGEGKALNVPQNGEKKILIFSDGVETVNVFGLAEIAAQEIKNNKINIYAVNIGTLSINNNVMKNISNSFFNYFDLQTYLKSGDGDLQGFVEYVSMNLSGSRSIRPVWYKAILNSNGAWVGTNDISDMVLNAGDYLAYFHNSAIGYTDALNINSSFATNGISFKVNVKLDGWDYNTSSFSISARGKGYGAKPFWGTVYTAPSSTYNFYKGTMALGGQIRFFDGYVPLQQPQISTMKLSAGDNIQYVRKLLSTITWNEPLTLSNTIVSNTWNKLQFSETYSNLSEFLRNNPYDGIINDTYIPSDIKLESYSGFSPAYYNYYALSAFTYKQNLYRLDAACSNSFVYYNTGVAIQTLQPYAHLDNVHYPTAATVSFPSMAVSDKQVGEYLLPEKLGAPYYRGRGFKIELDNNSLNFIDSISAERMYLDLEKYGPRNRGLTKKDQISPTKISDIDNRWIMEPYGSASKAGVIADARENQKLTPYQTSYEIYLKNYYGLARQDDMFQFWNPPNPAVWNDIKNYPLTLRNELPAVEYQQRVDKLLTNMGNLGNWRTDVYDNQYGFYKQFYPSDLNGLYMWFSADYGTLCDISNSYPFQNINSNTTSLTAITKWLDRSGKGNHLYASDNVLNLINNSPALINDPRLNNKLSVSFNQAAFNNNNKFNINSSGATLFVVGAYNHASDIIAKLNYQVLASFGTYISSLDIDNFNFGSMVISNVYGDFNFQYGNNSGYQPNSATNIYQIAINDNGIGQYYPPTSGFYVFESVFAQPYAQAYINGTLVADNSGTFVPSSTSTYFDTVLYSTNGFTLGSYINSHLSTNCSIAEVVYYNRNLSDSERKNVEKYLNDKYSIY